ncbi:MULTISPECIES: alpha/beta hydrolase [unclassified Rhizobium]|uniref:alpha/beta fold hydrolase n=1 Tax=unclassified Rhizobium TaxID=2613769 RepID=UPI0006F80B47|nr:MULTISPECIES: alpha/beta hydrolase [unclassified Rhizobium]KQV43813.1 hypothetical protein ASC86_03160 [Rhizobium sp. Root1212]
MKTVFIHGMVMSPAFWNYFAPAIVRQGCSVAYPLPGHSPWSLEDATLPLRTAEIVDAYAQAIERDFGGEPVTLIGHSTGGFVSLLLARHRPDLVSSVILMGAFACGRFEGQERIAARILRLPLLGRMLFITFFTRWISSRENFRWGANDCVFDQTRAWETEEALTAMEEVRDSLLNSLPDEIAAFVSWMSSTSVFGELADIDVPVLNIIGARDRIVPPSHQLHLSGGLSRVQTAILNDVGHLPMAEAREQVDRLVSHFLLFGPLNARIGRRSRPSATAAVTKLLSQAAEFGNKNKPKAFS